MGVVQIATNFNIDIEFVSPPFYKRLLAWIIDIIIQIFYIIIAGKVLSWIQESLDNTEDSFYTMWAIGLLLILPLFLYHLVMEVTMNGQSIGKKLMGIKVISESGGRPSLSQYIIRWLIRISDYTILLLILMVYYVQFYGVIIYWGMAGIIALLIGDVILVNSRKQQRLGDILAHTVLINTRQKEKITDTVFLEVADNYIPSYPQVMQLSDRDINAMKGILDTARKHHDFHLAAMAAEKIKNHLKIDSRLEPLDFLQVLLKDYNYLSVN